MPRYTIYIILIFFLIRCSEKKRSEVTEQIRELNSVTTYSPNVYPEYSIKLVHEQTFGNTSKILIGRVYGMAVDKWGRVFIGDIANHTIHVFQPDGSYLTSIGREGSGPGEFRHISSMKINLNHLFVYDSPQHRINVFSLDTLTFSNTIKLDWSSIQELSGSFPRHYFVRNDSTILVGFSTGAMVNRYTKYYIMNMKGEIKSDQLLELKEAKFFQNEELNMGSILPFNGNPLIAMSNNNHILSAWTEEFLIKVHDPNGKYLYGFYYPYQKSRLDRYRFIRSIKNEKFQKFYQEVKFPDTWPALNSMQTDDRSRLWVSTIIDDEKFYQWWILDETGKLLARFNWSRDRHIEEIKNGYLYTRETEEQTGLQHIVRYRIEMN